MSTADEFGDFMAGAVSAMMKDLADKMGEADAEVSAELTPVMTGIVGGVFQAYLIGVKDGIEVARHA